MCVSATVSYSATAVLVTAGLYAAQQARRLPAPYRLWAAIPVFFGIQQAFEGRVWQMLDAGNTGAAILYAAGFHFFSHFLWLWWMPLCCYLVETGKIRKWIIGGFALFGAFAGTLVYSAILTHAEWMSVAVREHSIYYRFTVPYRDSIHLPIPTAGLYAMTVVVPLLISRHNRIKIFGVLVLLSMLLASKIYSYAYISVWCLFAAVLSLYLVYMIRHFVVELKSAGA
jgi:hypothetical protein